jgi:SAM-dependent methyltransferase
MSDTYANQQVTVPSVKEEIKELILRSLQERYTSTSCQDGILTGNHYQSIRLGEERTSGFRSDRSAILDQIDFSGKKVLDLGSNLGELSRSARERGAYLVDGFEYDHFFLEVANLINVYNETTRVSFYQRDITNPGIYGEHYDIVLAFSVFTYMSRVLEQIFSITDKVFVLETHKLDGNLEAGYLNPVLMYFPYYKIIGESDWGSNQDSKEVRAIIAFAKDESTLLRCLSSSPDTDPSSGGGAAPSSTGWTLDSLGVNGNLMPVDGNIMSSIRDKDTVALHENDAHKYIDVGNTCLQEKFFSFFEFNSPEEVFIAVSEFNIDLDIIARSMDCIRYVYSGWVYWFLFTKGYLQYINSGVIDERNIYHEYMVKYYFPRGHDQGLKDQLDSPYLITKRIAQRFHDLDMLRNSSQDAKILEQFAPICVYISEFESEDELRLHDLETGAVLRAVRVDGWHRLFSAKLCGVEKLRYQVIRDETVKTS